MVSTARPQALIAASAFVRLIQIPMPSTRPILVSLPDHLTERMDGGYHSVGVVTRTSLSRAVYRQAVK